MSGRNLRAIGGRTSRIRIRGRARGRIIRGVRGIRSFRSSRIRQRGDFGMVTLHSNEGSECDYAMLKEESYKMKHYSDRYSHESMHYYRSRSRSRSRSLSRTRSRSRSRSMSRSPYRRFSHHRHYSRSRSRSYSPPRHRSRSISRSLSRSPPRRHRLSPRRPERSSTERTGPPKRPQEENRKREMMDRFQSRPVERYAKQPVKKEQVKIVKEQVKAVKEQVKAAREQVKIVKEQYKKMIPLPEVTRKETPPPPPVKEPVKLPVTIRDMPIYSEDESDNDLDSRLLTPQTKKEERFKFETDVSKDIRSQLLERAMIEKKKLGLENPGAAEKSSALEALQCYSPETHSPSPTSQSNYESHNIQVKKNPKKRKALAKKDPLKSIFKSSEDSGNKTECLPSIPGLGFSSIEDEEKFLYGDDEEKDNGEKCGSGDDDNVDDDDDDYDDGISMGGGSNIIQHEVKPKIKVEPIARSIIKGSVVESNDWSNSNVNIPLQEVAPKRRRFLTSGPDDNTIDYTRSEITPKSYASSTVHHEIIERKYSASGMIDLQLSEKLGQSVKDSPSQFSKSSLSPPIMKLAEKGSKLEFTSQFEAKPSLVTRRKDSLEERHSKHQSPSSDFERASNKSEKYFHSTLLGRRSKREESPPRKEHIPRYKGRPELYEEISERKHRERSRKAENLRTDERARDWEDSPRHRTPDRSPWRSPEERKKWDSYREYSRSPRNLSLERSSCHSRSPREPYYDRSPSHSPRRWSSPRREENSSRWSPRREMSPGEDDGPNVKSRDWPETSHRDHYYDRWHSPSPDERRSRSPSWNKEYENSYQQKATQSFDTASAEAYTTSQQSSNINVETTDTTSYPVPQPTYYQPVYPSVNPHLPYSEYNTTQFPQTASYTAPFQPTPMPYMNLPPPGYPPAVIQIQPQPPPTRAQENIVRTNLTVIPLQSETQKPKETKHVFSKLEDERKKSETSKCTFVTISDNNQGEYSQVSADYSSLSYRELLDKRTEKKKHLFLLRNEMAKLCKMQGEMMRKKQKEKDGHKDALIVENTKLQEEVSNQIQENKQELLQIKQAIRNFITEAGKQDVEKKQDKQQKKYEQERREQESEQNQKHRSEEKEDDVSDDLLDNETNFSFKYFDPGNHWCKLCNEVNASIYKLFEHLHSSKHRQKMDPCDRPWAPQKKWSEKSVSGQTIAAPIKGVQFLVPLESFYCSICKEILPDGSSAEEHLKSTSHNRNYTKYILLNPFYERRWNLDKAAGIAVAEKEEKKRQRELLIEARNKKREEAERQRKELIKNEKAKEVKRLHDIPVTKPLVEKDDKSKPKAIRLTLLGDKAKLTKQKKDEKMLSPKETKPVPVIYIGKAPNFRSMAHKQDTSGFGKFNWKKDENEIVPEDQTSIPEDFKPNQDDEKPKVEETEQIKDKTKHFPLRKSKKPQLNIVYGPEPPPDLHLLQTSVTQEKTDDGMLPSEIDIAQAFAGKFEGSEESATNSKKQGAVESTVTNKSSNTSSAKFLIIDETPSEPEFFQEETRPASNIPTGPSRQMMLMLRSVENMSKEAQYNVVTPKVTDNKYKQFVTTENSQLANKPTVAVAGNVSRIVPPLKPPGEEDIFFTENANIKPPPLLPKINQSENKPRISTMRNETSSAESAKDSINKPSTLPENVSKPTKIVVGNISKPATIMGNVNKSSTPLMASTNKPTTTVTGSVNRSTMAVANVNKCAVLGDTVNKTSVAVANKPPLVEGESAKKIISTTAENVNKLAVASEIVKYPAVTVVENENRSFSVTMGNIARIQPQQITNNIKSEEQKITKTIDRIIPDAIPVLQVGSSYQGGIESTGNATHVGTMTRPTKVQIIFPTVKTAEKSLPAAVPIIELKENLIESEVVAKPMTNSLKPQAGCIANAVQSKGQLNLINVEVARQTIPDEICKSILEKDQSNELEGNQSESESKVVLQPDETASKVQQDLSVAINDLPAILSDEKREETISLVSLEEEKKEESEDVKQNLNQVHDRSILIQEQYTQKCSLIESAEAVSICRSDEIDCLVTSIKSDLEKEDDVKCKTTKDDNTIETSEETMEVTSIHDNTIEVDVKDELITALSSEESSTQLSTSAGNRIVQVEEDSGFGKVFETTTNVVYDSETLSTSNILETRIPPGTHNETMHEEKETNMDTVSECNLKLSTCEVTDALKTSDIEANVINVYPECKAKQVDDQVSCNEAVMKVEHETLDNDGILNSVEDVAVSSTASETPIQKNKCSQEIDSETAVTSCSETGTRSDIAVESVVSLCSTNNDIPVTIKSIDLEITNTELPPKSRQEEADVSMEVESDTGLHSYSRAQCIAVNSTPKAEFAENTSDVSLKQEIINHSSHTVEEMDTSDAVEPSNMCLDDANVSNVTEEAESMDVDPGNTSLHSDDTVQCIIECSEANITECKPADKLDILRSLCGQEEKMDTDSGNFCFDSKTLDREEVKNESEQQRAAELLNNKSAEADIGTEKESKLSIDSEANVTESKMEQAPSNTALKKEESNDDKSILSSSEDKMNTTECTVLNAQISKELVESNEQATERKIDSAVKTEGVTSATESIVMKDEIKEISSDSKNEQPNQVAPSSKTEAKSSCDQLGTGCSCDEEALNLNEDTVEFYESQSPKEHIPENNGQVGTGSLSNLITFPKTETTQSEILESDREKNTQVSHDNVSSVTSTKIEDGVSLVKDVGQEIHSSTKIVSILDSTPESKQIEVDTEIKVTSSPKEETVEEIEEAGLVIPVGLSPTQQTEDKSDVHFQAAESRDELVQHTFGIDDADATIQALENLLEETKQLQSPVAKASVSKETTVEAEENAIADSEQKSDKL